jgi:hypothetical protein
MSGYKFIVNGEDNTELGSKIMGPMTRLILRVQQQVYMYNGSIIIIWSLLLLVLVPQIVLNLKNYMINMIYKVC